MADKVVFFNTLYGTRFDAGAEKVVTMYREELEARGLSTAVVSISDQPTSSVNCEDRHAIIRSPNIYFPHATKKRSVFKRIIFHIIDNFNPVSIRRIKSLKLIESGKVFFTHNLRGLSAGVWNLNNKNNDTVKVHYIHDYQLMCTGSTMVNRGKMCQTQCAHCQIFTCGRKFFSKNVDIVYGASHYVLKKHLEAGYFRNAVSRVVEPPLALTTGTIRDYIASPARRFGFLGRLVEEKGISQLLSAFEAFRNALPAQERGEVSLKIAGGGDGSFFSQIIEKIDRSEGISYAGFVSPSDFFNEIDILVVPSAWPDPNPFVVVEAYQYGKPVIGAYVGGIEGSVVHEQTGLHFVHDPQNLGLVLALRRSWEGVTFSAEAMRRAVERRDIRAAVDELIDDINARQESSVFWPRNSTVRGT